MADFFIGVVLALATMLCYGTWTNSVKSTVGKIEFEGFYFDVCIGYFLTAVLIGVIANCVTDGPGIFSGFGSCAVIYAIAAGVVFNAGQIGLCCGFALVGIAIGVAVGIGTVLVCGTMLTYAINERGNFLLLLVGVLFAVAAVLMNWFVGSQKEKHESKVPQIAEKIIDAVTGQKDVSITRKIMITVTGGLIFSIWPALASQTRTLNPYGMFIAFTGAALASGPFLLSMIARCPPAGTEPKEMAFLMKNYKEATGRTHLISFLGGAIFQVGSSCFGVAAQSLGFAGAFGIGNCAPLVALLWGYCYFGEFDGAPKEVKLLLLPVILFFACSVFCIASGSS